MVKQNVVSVSCLLMLLSLAATSDSKTHTISLTKLDKPESDQNWVQNISYSFKKSGNGKLFDLNITSKKDLEGPDILCQMKMFQKSGGKYSKSPWDFPEKSCCEFMEQYEIGWGCVQKRSSFPKRCPFLKGPHWIKDFSVDDCDYPAFMPLNMPEDYKIEVCVNKNHLNLLKLTLYIKIKKTMSFF